MRQAFLALIFVPWSCQCLVANIVNSRFSCHNAPYELSLTTSSLHSTNDSFVEHEESDLWSEHGNGDNLLRRQQKQQQIYLFSLNWIRESDPEYFRKKDVIRLWEWKDNALGDGRDFFVPKPKTLMALQQYFLDNIPNLIECSIISNCARLEVLCTYSLPFEQEKGNGLEQQPENILARDISTCFIAQLDHHRNLSKKSNPWTKMMMQLPVNVDNPDSVLTNIPPVVDPMKSVSHYDSWWNVTVGPKPILTHLCRVSAGMGRRPRRPDRAVVFRPYSSRDAHVLLQLKRTRENIGFLPLQDDTASTESKDAKSQKRKLLPIVLDYALRAGKAARNSDIVPEILELKEMTSAESSAGSASEQQTSERVANAAFEKGMKPLIEECVAKLDDSTNNIDYRIAEFRQNAFTLLNEIEPQGDDYKEQDFQKELRSWLNRRLHEPTVLIRSLARQQNDGTTKDVEFYLSNELREIQEELQEEHCRLQNHEREKTTFV